MIALIESRIQERPLFTWSGSTRTQSYFLYGDKKLTNMFSIIGDDELVPLDLCIKTSHLTDVSVTVRVLLEKSIKTFFLQTLAVIHYTAIKRFS